MLGRDPKGEVQRLKRKLRSYSFHDASTLYEGANHNLCPSDISIFEIFYLLSPPPLERKCPLENATKMEVAAFFRNSQTPLSSPKKISVRPLILNDPEVNGKESS